MAELPDERRPHELPPELQRRDDENEIEHAQRVADHLDLEHPHVGLYAQEKEFMVGRLDDPDEAHVSWLLNYAQEIVEDALGDDEEEWQLYERREAVPPVVRKAIEVLFDAGLILHPDAPDWDEGTDDPRDA